MKKILLIVTLLITGIFTTPVDAKIEVGSQAPELLGTDLKGNKILLSNLKGKIVLISFWATWCPPCLQEMPVLEAIKKSASDKLEVIAISFKQSKKDYRKMVKKLDKFHIQFTFDRKSKISNKFGVKSIPYLVILDNTGKVAFIHKGFGENSTQNILDDVNTLLSMGIMK